MSVSAADLKARQTEREFQKEVEKAAQLCGWYCLAFPNAIYNPPGWPDLMCFRQSKMILLELKGEKGRLGPRQLDMHFVLKQHGIKVHLFRPSQWDALEELLKHGPS